MTLDPDHKTTYLDARPGTPDDELARVRERAATILQAGGLVAVPTDTVYGIAVRGDFEQSVDRLYRLKDRQREKSMTVHLGSGDATTLARHTAGLPPVAARLARQFWPGPLTLVVPGRALPDDEETLVGLRVPNYPLLQGILNLVPAPVLIPSANLSGLPPLTNALAVQRAFGGKLDAIVDGGDLGGGPASTVVLVRLDSWEVLREGAIPSPVILNAAVVKVLFCCTGNTCRSPMAELILRAALEEALGTDDLTQVGLGVRSAGVSASDGAPASDGARRAMARRGLSLAAHRSAPLTAASVAQANVIFAMTRQHLEAILYSYPEAPAMLLDPSGRDIGDPIHGDDAIYDSACEQIERSIAARLPDVLELAGFEAK